MVRVCDQCGVAMEYRDLYCPHCNPDGVTVFEGITKEAADKLKDRIAALKSALRKIRDAGCYNCSMAAQNALEEDDG